MCPWGSSCAHDSCTRLPRHLIPSQRPDVAPSDAAPASGLGVPRPGRRRQPSVWTSRPPAPPSLQAAGPSPNQCSPVSVPKPSRYASQPRKKFTEPSARRWNTCKAR